ncbi:putative leader peptide [Saccharopolyspora gregorii]
MDIEARFFFARLHVDLRRHASSICALALP